MGGELFRIMDEVCDIIRGLKRRRYGHAGYIHVSRRNYLFE